MKPLIPVAMTMLLLAGYNLGDKMPLLNAYEIVRHSGMGFLPQSGADYIADQAKFGRYALLAAWAAWIAGGAVLAWLMVRVYQLVR